MDLPKRLVSALSGGLSGTCLKEIAKYFSDHLLRNCQSKGSALIRGNFIDDIQADDGIMTRSPNQIHSLGPSVMV